MPFFEQNQINQIKSEFALINSRYTNLLIKLQKLHSSLKIDEAKEYLTHGVMRRMGIIKRSIENVFTIFPIERIKRLSMDELRDVDINLHAFYINIFGFLDNLAWVFIHEKQPAAKINKMGIGLYKKETQKYLMEEFRNYLNSEHMKKWYDEYLINYRDALSHRIPLYVPPKTLTPEQASQVEQIENKIADCWDPLDWDMIEKFHNEQDSIGDICFFIKHAFSESKSIVLHAQLIADFNTIEEIVEKYCEMFLE